MARQLRLEFAGGLHHLTARGNAQVAIYEDDDDRKRFLDLLGREANVSLKEVAELFGVSPSRISHIQRSMEMGRLSRLQQKAMRLCNVKQ